jgi:hypothetical protein
MTQLMNDERPEGEKAEFRIGSWERPDPAGIVLRGEAVGFRGYFERVGEAPVCYVGSRPGRACKRPAVMEVYQIPMCEVHGEEAASGALAEIVHDLDQELQRPMNPYVRSLGPHVERALEYGASSLGEEAANTGGGQRDGDLLRAFPPRPGPDRRRDTGLRRGPGRQRPRP